MAYDTLDSTRMGSSTTDGHGMKDGLKGVTEGFESIPTNVYIGGVLGSILISALLFVMGKRTAGIFVGLWPPTILNMAMVYKRLRPSKELS